MSNNVNFSKKEPPEYIKVIIILVLVFSIIWIFNTFNETKKDTAEFIKRAEEVKEKSKEVSFNCPYCKAYVSIKPKYISESGGCTCPNCRKYLKIDTYSGKVTYKEY